MSNEFRTGQYTQGKTTRTTCTVSSSLSHQYAHRFRCSRSAILVRSCVPGHKKSDPSGKERRLGAQMTGEGERRRGSACPVDAAIECPFFPMFTKFGLSSLLRAHRTRAHCSLLEFSLICIAPCSKARYGFCINSCAGITMPPNDRAFVITPTSSDSRKKVPHETEKDETIGSNTQ